jgi:hypothetical protein
MRTLVLSCLTLTLAAPAFADDFVPSRPGNTESPVTVPVGHWQVESELGSFSHGSGGESWSALSTDIRYGIAPGWEGEAIISPINRSGGETGFGDTTLRVRHMLTDPASDGPAVALIGFVTLPTATDHQGNGGLEGGLIGTGTFDLTDTNGVTWTLGAASVRNNGDNQSDVFGGAALSHKFTQSVGAYIEAFADHTDHVRVFLGWSHLF